MPALLELAQPDDMLLLRCDAAYLLLSQPDWPCQVSVLQQDLIQRGIVCPSSVHAITDTQWVELTLQASQVISCPD